MMAQRCGHLGRFDGQASAAAVSRPLGWAVRQLRQTGQTRQIEMGRQEDAGHFVQVVAHRTELGHFGRMEGGGRVLLVHAHRCA